MIRRLIAPAAVAGVLALVALAGSAAAQTPSGPTGTSTPTTPPPAPPAEARLAIKVPSGIVDQHVRWFLTGDKLLAKGKIYPYVAGQKVVIELHKSSGELVGQHTVKVEKTDGTAGKFQHRLQLRELGWPEWSDERQGSLGVGCPCAEVGGLTAAYLPVSP